MKANRLIFYAFMFHIYLWLVQQITRFSCTKRQRRQPTRATRRPRELPPPPPHPPTALASKLELTFLKLNESAVSGKWISNIFLKNILQKNEQKAQRKTRKMEAKLTVKIRLKYASGCLPRPQPLELFPQDVRA